MSRLFNSFLLYRGCHTKVSLNLSSAKIYRASIATCAVRIRPLTASIFNESGVRPQAFNVRYQTMATSSPGAGDTSSGVQFHEKKGDLFSCDETESLAHCVSVDLRMGKGIATLFKNQFGGVQELKQQGKQVGEVAVLKREKRMIYYLITKEKYWGKPTYDTLQASLQAMKKHCLENEVKAISMPRIGCGLDLLQWPKVKAMILEVFQDTNMTVTIYTL